jgi:hypothetical protein
MGTRSRGTDGYQVSRDRLPVLSMARAAAAITLWGTEITNGTARRRRSLCSSEARELLSNRRRVRLVGLYLSPPAPALVLSVDEKSRIQALDREQPVTWPKFQSHRGAFAPALSVLQLFERHHGLVGNVKREHANFQSYNFRVQSRERVEWQRGVE